MKRYFKEEKEYLKWLCNHNYKYFIYSKTTTPHNTICIKYYPIEFNKKVIQYDMNNKVVREWKSIAQAVEELKFNGEEIFKASIRPFGTCYGFKWYYLRGR